MAEADFDPAQVRAGELLPDTVGERQLLRGRQRVDIRADQNAVACVGDIERRGRGNGEIFQNLLGNHAAAADHEVVDDRLDAAALAAGTDDVGDHLDVAELAIHIIGAVLAVAVDDGGGADAVMAENDKLEMADAARLAGGVGAERHDVAGPLQIDMLAEALMKQRLKADVLPAELDGIEDCGAAMVDQTGKRNTEAEQLIRTVEILCVKLRNFALNRGGKRHRREAGGEIQRALGQNPAAEVHQAQGAADPVKGVELSGCTVEFNVDRLASAGGLALAGFHDQVVFLKLANDLCDGGTADVQLAPDIGSGDWTVFLYKV